MKYVYFLRAADGTGPIKIGSSSLPRRRLMQCSMWSPVPLTLMASVAGSVFHERALHEKFEADRLHGEWFAPSTDLASVISGINAGSSLQDLGIVPSRWQPAKGKDLNTRLKQGLSVKLTFARKRAGPETVLPSIVEKALSRWQHSADVASLDSERRVIERHISELAA